jgi:riboflavin synthase alpha subunit
VSGHVMQTQSRFKRKFARGQNNFHISGLLIKSLIFKGFIGVDLIKSMNGADRDSRVRQQHG